MKPLAIFCCLIFLFSCKNEPQSLTAQQIVDNAISTSCSGNCEKASIHFKFRDKLYRSERRGGYYQYERITTDSSGVTLDRLSNDSFERYKNGGLIQVEDSIAAKYANSVNSVHYFTQLPYGLNAPAVQKELLGEAIIKKQSYYEIKVTFNKEGGGTDYDDTFIYWIHQEHFTVDYLAYKYATDGGGIRFREAYNPRVVNGIRFVDYNNFKPQHLNIALSDLDKLFEDGQLELLSKIITENVQVTLPDS